MSPCPHQCHSSALPINISCSNLKSHSVKVKGLQREDSKNRTSMVKWLLSNHSSSCSRKSIWLGTPQFIRLQDNQTKSSESGTHDLYVMIKFQIVNLAVFTARSEILLYVLIQITFYSETSCCWVEKLDLGHFMIISWFWVTFMDWEYPHNTGRMAYVTWGGCDLIFHYPWRNTPFPRKKSLPCLCLTKLPSTSSSTHRLSLIEVGSYPNGITIKNSLEPTYMWKKSINK